MVRRLARTQRQPYMARCTYPIQTLLTSLSDTHSNNPCSNPFFRRIFMLVGQVVLFDCPDGCLAGTLDVVVEVGVGLHGERDCRRVGVGDDGGTGKRYVSCR